MKGSFDCNLGKFQNLLVQTSEGNGHAFFVITEEAIKATQCERQMIRTEVTNEPLEVRSSNIIKRTAFNKASPMVLASTLDCAKSFFLSQATSSYPVL